MTTDLINQVFSDQSTRIVSMRVYNLDVEEQIGENNSKNWKNNINQDLPNHREHNGDFNFKYGEAYFVNDNDDNRITLNTIVQYPSINNSE